MAKKILIVEDEHILASMYADRFRQEGWKVNIATTSDKGLEMTKKENPSIVLLDILLFDGHGTEYLRTKKEDDAIAKIPVIVFFQLRRPQNPGRISETGRLRVPFKNRLHSSRDGRKSKILLTVRNFLLFHDLIIPAYAGIMR